MSVWPRLARDLRRYEEGKRWSRGRAVFEGFVLDSGFQALVTHRIAHTLKRWGVPLLPAVCRRWGVAACAVDILPAAEIGGGCVIAHGVGTVIGGNSVIGEDCTILQGVTLGEARFSEDACPRIGDRVILGAGAKILGGITVGDDTTVAAGAVVVEDVPSGCVAAGVPARIIGSREADPTA